MTITILLTGICLTPQSCGFSHNTPSERSPPLSASLSVNISSTERPVKNLQCRFHLSDRNTPQELIKTAQHSKGQDIASNIEQISNVILQEHSISGKVWHRRFRSWANFKIRREVLVSFERRLHFCVVLFLFNTSSVSIVINFRIHCHNRSSRTNNVTWSVSDVKIVSWYWRHSMIWMVEIEVLQVSESQGQSHSW